LECQIGWRAALLQYKCRAERRMTGKRQLLARREDPHVVRRPLVGRLRDERRLGKVHLTRDLLHGVAVEAFRIEKDREWISAEARGRENVHMI
jgi:hypothetical protein